MSMKVSTVGKTRISVQGVWNALESVGDSPTLTVWLTHPLAMTAGSSRRGSYAVEKAPVLMD